MKGCIHIYTGNGKGKTTAALGLAVRAHGAGLNVYFGQFIKDGKYSETKALKKVLGRLNLDQYFWWITTYKSHTKAAMGKVVSLDLSWHAIHELPSNFLEGLNHLETLRLDNNPHLTFRDGCFDDAQAGGKSENHDGIEFFNLFCCGSQGESLHRRLDRCL